MSKPTDDSELDEILLVAYKEVCDEHYNEGDVDQDEEARDWLERSDTKQKIQRLVLEARVDELEHIVQTGDKRVYTFKSKLNNRNIPIKDRLAELRKQLGGSDE